jgi:hypothetical protein
MIAGANKNAEDSDQKNSISCLEVLELAPELRQHARRCDGTIHIGLAFTVRHNLHSTTVSSTSQSTIRACTYNNHRRVNQIPRHSKLAGLGSRDALLPATT